MGQRMALLDEKTIVGELKEYTRASFIEIFNGLGSIPEIRFHQEKIISLPTGQNLNFNSGVLSEKMENPFTEIDMLDPNTDAIVGKINYGQIYSALYSLHRSLAKKGI